MNIRNNKKQTNKSIKKKISQKKINKKTDSAKNRVTKLYKCIKLLNRCLTLRLKSRELKAICNL